MPLPTQIVDASSGRLVDFAQGARQRRGRTVCGEYVGCLEGGADCRWRVDGGGDSHALACEVAKRFEPAGSIVFETAFLEETDVEDVGMIY